MSRRDEAPMNAHVRRELDAIDAALRGEEAGGSDPALFDLARTLQVIRARPSEDYARALDARAAAGFRRARRARTADAPPRNERVAARMVRAAAGHRVQLASALAMAVAVSLLAAVAVSQWRSGAGTPAQHAERASGALSTSEPAVIAPSPALKAPATRTGTAGGGTFGADGAGSSVGAAARRIERTSTLDVGVAPGSIESSAQRVFTTVSSFNGYVRQSGVSFGSQGGASFDIRLPTSNLSAAIASLSHLGHVRSENDTTNDVTSRFDSLQHSIEDLQAERSSLLRRLAATTDARSAAALRARLHGVEGAVARARGTMDSLRTRIDYNQLSLSLTPEAAGGAGGGDLTPGGAARNAGQILEAALAVLVIGAAAVFPAALLAIAAWSAVALTRRRLRERALDAP
jgi:hypothetical protein